MGGPGGPGQVNLAEYMSQELGDREWVGRGNFCPVSSLLPGLLNRLSLAERSRRDREGAETGQLLGLGDL